MLPVGNVYRRILWEVLIVTREVYVMPLPSDYSKRRKEGDSDETVEIS